jgi:hypothetical protein
MPVHLQNVGVRLRVPAAISLGVTTRNSTSTSPGWNNFFMIMFFSFLFLLASRPRLCRVTLALPQQAPKSGIKSVISGVLSCLAWGLLPAPPLVIGFLLLAELPFPAPELFCLGVVVGVAGAVGVPVTSFRIHVERPRNVLGLRLVAGKLQVWAEFGWV